MDEYCVGTSEADPDPWARPSDRFHCARFPERCSRSPTACDCLVDAGIAMSLCSNDEALTGRGTNGRRVDVSVVRTAAGLAVPLMCLTVPCPDGTYCVQER